MTEGWSVFSNHGLVLMTLAGRPDIRLRDIAEAVGITERAALAIVGDLATEGYVERIREGRRNHYVVRGDRLMTHPATGDHEVGDLLSAFAPRPKVSLSPSPCLAIALGCSDFQYQELFRSLLASERLLDRTEIVLWPGGGSALAGPDAARILTALANVMAERGAQRVLLTAHQGCAVRGAVIRPRRDPFSTQLAVIGRRRRVVDGVRRRLGIEPELWFLDTRGARRVRTSPLSARPPVHGFSH